MAPSSLDIANPARRKSEYLVAAKFISPMDSKEYHMGHHDSPGFVETLLYFSGCRVIIMLCIAMYPWESVSKVKSMMFLTSILALSKGTDFVLFNLAS
jgi:hypothetical protein